MFKKLSGWKRIGLVVSVIWFIGFGGYLWVSGVGHMSDFHMSQLKMCGTIMDVANEALQYIPKLEDRQKRQDENWSKYEDCQKRAGELFSQSFEQQRKAIPILLAIDFGTILFGWFVAWGLTAIVKWIRRGFASV